MKSTVIHRRKFTVLGLTAVLLAGAVSAGSAADGAGIFAANCAQCHGTTGHADTPAGKALKAPALAGDAKVAAAGQDDVVTLVKQNPKHAPVLGKLSADDITAAAAYVKQMAGGRQGASMTRPSHAMKFVPRRADGWWGEGQWVTRAVAAATGSASTGLRHASIAWPTLPK